MTLTIGMLISRIAYGIVPAGSFVSIYVFAMVYLFAVLGLWLVGFYIGKHPTASDVVVLFMMMIFILLGGL